MKNEKRIVITGIGLISPIGNTLNDLRQNLLNKKSGIINHNLRYIGNVPAGVCNFDSYKYQSKKEIKKSSRAGSIAIYVANEALNDAGLNLIEKDTSKIGVYVGTTEHGNVETENEIYNISKYNYDLQFWSHHLSSKIVSNNPAGEITVNLKIKGPHFCIGGACAASNLAIIQGYQMLKLEEIDTALVGGVSESINTFGIFASFKSQNALASHDNPEKACRPFDKKRNGIVISEGGCIFILETLESALKRKVEKIYGEIVGYAINSDASDYVIPYSLRQSECMQKSLDYAGLKPNDIDIISTHATSTILGDISEINAIKKIFNNSCNTYINNSKSFFGHAMGAAGALELAGNILSFNDNLIHSTLNIEDLDKECEIKNLVYKNNINKNSINYILNNSFGMLGINSAVIVKKYL